LKAAGCVLGVSIFLGWTITDPDTWLHTDSSTIQMATSTATTSRTYSQDVSENFTATETTSNDSLVPQVCLFVGGVGGGLSPNNRTEAFATAFNTSSLNQIVMYDHEYALLVPVSTDIRLDFIIYGYNRCNQIYLQAQK
jgi:hypothetical protein